MRLRYLALAAAMAFSAPAWAASTMNTTTDKTLQGPEANFLGEAYINPNPSSIDAIQQEKDVNFTLSASQAAAGLYSFWIAGFSTLDSEGKSSSGLFYASLLDSLGTVIKELDLRVQGATPYLANYWTDIQLTAGTYTVHIEGSHIGKTYGQTEAAAGVRLGNVTQVPGPEAGAGLGALALGGMALYMKRRRKEEATAA